MIIKYSLNRLFIIFLLIILFPLVQKQWLNLYLFDNNNFSIYKILYYLSGLICPILVIRNSLNNFTFYKFKNRQEQKVPFITGKALLLITLIVLFILSILITNYIFINIELILNLFFGRFSFIGDININKQIIFLLIISIFLLFRNIKLFLKKALLINYFIMSILIWFLETSNSVLNDSFIINILNIENINYVNLLFLLVIEIFYYLWSYISYGSFLSDWILPVNFKKDFISISNIIFFYLLIFLYYTLLP